MEIVNYLALLWGFSLIIVFLLILLRPKVAETALEVAHDEKMLLLIGLINTVLGIALILLYNVWDASWHAVISLIGWLVLLRGILILFFPVQRRKIVAFFKKNINHASYLALACIILGCFLVFMGLSY